MLKSIHYSTALSQVTNNPKLSKIYSTSD